jgi:hypothetical protein
MLSCSRLLVQVSIIGFYSQFIYYGYRQSVSTSGIYVIYDTEKDEFDAEGAVVDTSSGDKEEEPAEVSQRFAGNKNRNAPEQMAQFLWGQARKIGSDFTKDEWKTVNQKSLIKSYTAHPEASMFDSQMVDVECPDLKFKEKVDLEKQVFSLA